MLQHWPLLLMFSRCRCRLPGCVSPVRRHPLDGKSLAAMRVGQQPLQGFHLAMTAFLGCLCNMCLKPPDLSLDPGPVDPLPVDAGRCTHRVARVHLLSFCMGGSSSYLANRDHEDVSPFSRGVMLQPLSAPLQDGVRFFPILVPALP